MKQNNKDFCIAKENTLGGKIFYFFSKFLLSPIVRLAWIKRIDGLGNLPKEGPFIIAANHQSYFDFISLFATIPFRLRFLAAEKFYHSKFWRPIMDYTGQIKVERDAKDKSEVVNKAIEVLAHNKVLGIFPQGTRSRSGEIEKTFTGVAKIAIRARVKVVPAGIKGAYEVMDPHAKRPKLKKIIEINIGEPIDLQDYYNKDLDKDKYRDITNQIMKKIALLSSMDYKEE